MISYFNSDHPDRYVVVLLITAVIWLPSLFSAEFIPLPASPAYQGFAVFARNYTWLIIWVSLVMTFLLGVMLNQILKEYDLVNTNNTSSLFFFILFASSIPLFTSINAIIIVNIFLVMAMQGIMQLSKVEYPVAVIFNTSFYLGVASLFFPPLLFLFIIIWLAILMNRHMDPRNFFITLTGLVLPFFFLFVWYFWNGTFLQHWLELTTQLTSIQIQNIFKNLTTPDLIILLFLLLILLFSILKIWSGLGKTSITARRNVKLWLYYLSGLMLLVILYATTPLVILALIPPIAALVAHALYEVKNKWLNILFILFFLVIIFNQYGSNSYVKSLLLR